MGRRPDWFLRCCQDVDMSFKGIAAPSESTVKQSQVVSPLWYDVPVFVLQQSRVPLNLPGMIAGPFSGSSINQNLIYLVLLIAFLRAILLPRLFGLGPSALPATSNFMHHQTRQGIEFLTKGELSSS
jgi:hypothetical protein